MGKRSTWLGIAAALLLAGGGGAALALADGDGEASPAATATPTTDSADAGFARDMAVHHQQAVEMSFVIRARTDDEEIRRLAYDIANTQANQRGMLLGWLSLWGLPVASGDAPMGWMDMAASPAPGHDGALMPGMATKTQMKRLGELSGKEAEILFLQLMTEHHKGGVHMAQGCVDRCEVGVEQRLAQGMVDAQESEIELMADLLRARGAEAR
ncbi:DUF305 domain-containing protein [Streptomyces sp. KLOTTS4A1]|uniref:DUF305 domain-containing protein n=1 Tax=Streptomyces sp. KLOTTS4A1 TaxID=3390996 RepID=UPI0039F5A039